MMIGPIFAEQSLALLLRYLYYDEEGNVHDQRKGFISFFERHPAKVREASGHHAHGDHAHGDHATVIMPHKQGKRT